MSGLTIGSVAKGAGVSVETIRFHERHGLIVLIMTKPATCYEFKSATYNCVKQASHYDLKLATLFQISLDL